MFNVTVSEAALYLGVSEPRIYQLINNGSLEAEKVGSIWLISQASLDARKQGVHAAGRPKKDEVSGEAIKQYVLMSRQHPVLKFSYNNETKKFFSVNDIFDAARAPLGLISPRGVRASDSAFSAWWNHRAIPLYREGIEQKLKELGVSNPSQIPFRSLGLSLSDQYWACPFGQDIKWEDINYFDNDFEQAEVDNEWLSQVGLQSPDNTSDGQLPKTWVTYHGKRQLLKGGSVLNQEPYNELIATKLYERLLEVADFVPYELKEWSGATVSVCNCFVSPEEEYVPAYYVKQLLRKPNHHNEYQHYIECCASLGVDSVEQALAKMIVCDDILANTDRHWRNFGLVRNVETLEFRVAPLFDSGTSLWCNTPVAQLYVRDFSFTTKPFYEDPSRQLRLVNDYDWLDLDKLDGFVDEAHDILMQNVSLADRVDLICSGMQGRINRIERIL